MQFRQLIDQTLDVLPVDWLSAVSYLERYDFNFAIMVEDYYRNKESNLNLYSSAGFESKRFPSVFQGDMTICKPCAVPGRYSNNFTKGQRDEIKWIFYSCKKEDLASQFYSLECGHFSCRACWYIYLEEELLQRKDSNSLIETTFVESVKCIRNQIDASSNCASCLSPGLVIEIFSNLKGEEAKDEATKFLTQLFRYISFIFWMLSKLPY
jgi:hypothetical protein